MAREESMWKCAKINDKNVDHKKEYVQNLNVYNLTSQAQYHDKIGIKQSYLYLLFTDAKLCYLVIIIYCCINKEEK